MSDWEWGYERGLWNTDGIPYDLFETKSRFVKPRKIENEHNERAKCLLLVREKIESLKKEERKLKEELKSTMLPYSFMEIDSAEDGNNQKYIIQRKCHKKPQRLKSLMFTENYIRQTYGHKISQDILENCTIQSKKIDTIYVFKKIISEDVVVKDCDISFEDENFDLF